jgi:hypothetical protein
MAFKRPDSTIFLELQPLVAKATAFAKTSVFLIRYSLNLPERAEWITN